MSDQPTASEPTDANDPDAGPSPVLVDPTPVDPGLTAPTPETTPFETAPLETIPADGPTQPTLDAPVTEPVAAPTPPPPSDPTGPPPWPTTAPGPFGPAGPVGPPTLPPQPPTPPPRRPGAWKQFVAGALVGALVGGATAGGVYLATKDDTTSRTVIVRQSSGGTRNTSAIAETRDIQGILQKVEPAVVAIRTGGAVTGDPNANGGAGTGFVISADGVIVTNNHVVEGAGGEIEVAFTDGTSQKAKVLGTSPENDLAVLKVDGTNLPFAQLGSSDSLQVGDEVIAIGNALALEGGLSVTRGIISAKDRTVPEQDGARLFNVLQTDAAINPGNSGGPLVNSDGEVVGINTAIADPQEAQNVGFAMSIDTVKSVIEDLRTGKQVKTAFLGVETSEVTPAVAKELDLSTDRGVVIRRVTANSAAKDAGLKTDDVIVAVSGNEVTSPDELAAQIRKSNPGDKVDVLIERNGSQQTISVTLGTRPQANG